MEDSCCGSGSFIVGTFNKQYLIVFPYIVLWEYMAIEKQVKEYSKRQRINLKVSDGFKADDTVYVLSEQEYKELTENQSDKNAEIVLTKIYEQHEKQIENKDKQIKQLSDRLDAIRGALSKYNTSLAGLSAIDIIFRSKHKDLIKDFEQRIWIIRNDDDTISSENSEKSIK